MPVAPEFQDPPEIPNAFPYFENFEPFQESPVDLSLGNDQAPYQFSVSVGDKNLDDTLYVRWVADYPPYVQNVTRLLVDTPKGMGLPLPPPIPRTEVRQGAALTLNITCAQFTGNMQQHRLVVIVADRPFLDVGLFTGVLRYNRVGTRTDGSNAPETYPIMAGWVITCRE